MRDGSLVRLGAAFGLVGAALGVLANLLHPRTPDEGAIAQFELVAESGFWNLDHYLVLLAVLFIVGGYFALERYSEGTPAAAWARLGLFVAVAGAAVGAILVAVEGYAFKALADHWAAAGRPTEGPAFESLNVARELGNGLFNVFTGIAVGFAPILGGIATIKNGSFVPWLGAFGLVGGAIGIGVDIFHVTSGATPFSSNVAFTAAALIVTIWAVVLNWSMFQFVGRRAEVVEPRGSEA